MYRPVLISLITLTIMSCSDVIKTDYGISGGNYLTIIAPRIGKIPVSGISYITNNSAIVDCVFFKGDQHKEPFDYNVGYTVYPGGYTTEGKRYIFLSNSVVFQRQYNAKSDFRIFLNYKKIAETNDFKYILEYDHILDTVHSELFAFSQGSYYKDAGQIYRDFEKDIYFIFSFEYNSSYDPESVASNFQRILSSRYSNSTDPLTGKPSGCYSVTVAESRADVYLSVYPYQNGSKAIATGLIYPEESNHIIDFTREYNTLSNELKTIVND
jgi:hypothetical protein